MATKASSTSNKCNTIRDFLHFIIEWSIRLVVGEKLERYSWFRKALKRLAPGCSGSAIMEDRRHCNTDHGRTSLKGFVVSEGLARQVLDLKRSYVRGEPEANGFDHEQLADGDLEDVCIELGQIWHGQIVAFANVLRTARQPQCVLIDQQGRLDHLVLEIINAIGGLPPKDLRKRDELITQLSREYAGWISSAGKMSYSWGTLESRDGAIVMTIQEHPSVTLDELITRAGLHY